MVRHMQGAQGLFRLANTSISENDMIIPYTWVEGLCVKFP